MLARALGVWVVLVLLAVANGTLRNALIVPVLGEYLGHVLSTVTLCALILLATRLSIGWIGARTPGDARRIGTLWVLLTVGFEFLAGHYLFHNSWQKLLADYNIFRGRLWLLVLIVTFVAPRLMLRQTNHGDS